MYNHNVIKQLLRLLKFKTKKLDCLNRSFAMIIGNMLSQTVPGPEKYKSIYRVLSQHVHPHTRFSPATSDSNMFL